MILQEAETFQEREVYRVAKLSHLLFLLTLNTRVCPCPGDVSLKNHFESMELEILLVPITDRDE